MPPSWGRICGNQPHNFIVKTIPCPQCTLTACVYGQSQPTLHNHDWEFTGHADGASLLDLLLDATDPALVALELDAYWATYAGADPVAYLQRRIGRVPLVHVKDMTPERTFAEVGDGTLDMGAIITAARAAGARWYIVENDAPTIPSLDSARRSLTNLQAMAE